MLRLILLLCCLLPGSLLARDFAPAPLAEAERTTLRQQVLDRQQPLAERIAALRQLYVIDEAEPILRHICIWDPAGRAGPIFTAAQEQQTRIMDLGVDVTLQVYTNEGVLVDELKSRHCDAALMTGLRARLFNTFTGTVDAVGALPDDTHMERLLELLVDPRLAPQLEANGYTVLGIAPGGGAYVFVNDRRINSLAKATGKRIPVLDYDPVQARMVSQIGATPVASDIVSAPNKFNNGSVDVMPAPLVAYEVMELYKGLGDHGGVIDYPLAQVSVQLIGHSALFPPEVAQLVREGFLAGLPEIRLRLKAEADKVPARYWISIPEQDRAEYETLMQNARLQLRDEGYYDARMLTLQRRLRCHLNSSRAECSQELE